jgi:hypothetical protein
MDAATYQRARASGMRAVDALRLARWITEDRIEVPGYGQPVTIERDGFTLTLSLDYDEGITLADLGYGTFDDGREDWRTGYWHPTVPGAIPNPNRDSRSPGNGARFYVPGDASSGWFDYCRSQGMSKSVAWDAARQRERDEAKEVTWDYGPSVYVLTVKASRNGIELGRASLGGIEIAWSDITRTDGSEYLAEIADDLVPEAIADAREALAGLAVSA